MDSTTDSGLDSTTRAPELRDTYFELSEHSIVQVVIFLLLLVGGAYIFFALFGIPVMHAFFRNFLEAEVTQSGTPDTNYFTRWLVLAHPKSAEETTYGYNPLLSLLPFTLAAGLLLAVALTSILPLRLGYMRQKIEREIINMLDRISRRKYGEHTESELRAIVGEILRLDSRELHDYALEIGIPFDELETLKLALRWRQSSLAYRIFNVGDVIRLYMRLYFTVQYSNAVLGLVYIGAAMLIIIIGIRGLKFIPASEPSVILFALALEFILLMVYAVTTIFSPQEDAPEHHPEKQVAGGGAASTGAAAGAALRDENSRDVENLLRVFAARRHNGEG